MLANEQRNSCNNVVKNYFLKLFLIEKIEFLFFIKKQYFFIKTRLNFKLLIVFGEFWLIPRWSLRQWRFNFQKKLTIGMRGHIGNGLELFVKIR